MNSITAHQIVALRAAAGKAFGKCDCSSAHTCDYHDWLASNFHGIASTKDLSHDQAIEAIRLLRKATGYKSPPLKKGGQGGFRRQFSGTGQRRGNSDMLTQKQADKIAALCELMEWNEQRLNGFIRHQIGTNTAVQMLMQYQAVKVIIGMQKIAAAGNQRIYNFLNAWTPARGAQGKAIIKMIREKISKPSHFEKGGMRGIQ